MKPYASASHLAIHDELQIITLQQLRSSSVCQPSLRERCYSVLPDARDVHQALYEQAGIVVSGNLRHYELPIYLP